ncbi:hypothetical protein GGR56DRAFT_461419 [Xylariaceae sp. FL0804]|nr:hypothetical protein GGR56DRAFT_461419 [Xylariaceae sp. FL0804]
MADLMGGRGPPTSNGNGASARPTTARAAVGSPSGIRGPRAIMQQRQAREQKRQEDRERLEREHAAQEIRLQEEALEQEAERRSLERRQAGHQAAIASAVGAVGAGQADTMLPPGVENFTRRYPPPRQPVDDGGRTAEPPRETGGRTQASHIPGHGRSASGPAQDVPGRGAAAAASSGKQAQSGDLSASMNRGRNSFPHAFERWETLSAHWEGLTSFWIHQLEQRAAEIDKDPLAQQLSRHVNDLSTAGSNLFHAIVELQRVRASSERKFQRWFFEVRAVEERSKEINGELNKMLDAERASRDTAVREAYEQGQGTSKLQKQIAELRKELSISKEEARRAWEELGRRETEERARTLSLQQGLPTIVGGVQVVPMTQSVSRDNSQRDPRYSQAESPDLTQSPTPGARSEYAQAPPAQTSSTSAGGNPTFQTPSHVQHQQSYGSEGDYSEEEFETPATQPGVYQPVGGRLEQPHSAPDYSGSGYSVPGWDEMQNPRHHHPTRLSDVLEEEEERSRTSASQVSRP